MILKACKYCGNLFEARISEHKAGRAVYCSRKCVTSGRDQYGPKNPKWLGGISLKEKGRRYRIKYPLKKTAHYMLTNAIRAGTVSRRPCETCGKQNAEAHHNDYNKPLVVRWLCKKHHIECHQ